MDDNVPKVSKIVNNDDNIIKTLIHLTIMNDLVKQINNKKIKILKQIYKQYFKDKTNMTYIQFQWSIFKKNKN